MLFRKEGIRIALDCDLSLISRLLKKNEKEGYIYRMLMKIKNKKRKQNAFFLTEKGLNLAEELHEKYPNHELKKEKVCITQKYLREF
jgi:DNA-binding MarR family transcriptional regulator